MNKTTKIVLAAACALALCYGIYAAVTAGKRFSAKASLTILHVNDTHSHLEPEKSSEYAGKGGIIERAAYVDSVRQADGAENVLLLHAGDFSQGTSYFGEFGMPLMISEINAMRYDAFTLGNHEFDNGLEALGEALSASEVPCVVCNYDFSPFEAGKYIKPYVIIEKAGKKIGIVGVLCPLDGVISPEISNRIPAFDMVPTVQKYVDEIKPQCDFVIALTHLGYTEHAPGEPTDIDLCKATRGIDMIIGGHSHSFMAEPDCVPNIDGKKVPIVQTGWMGVWMGEYHVKL